MSRKNWINGQTLIMAYDMDRIEDCLEAVASHNIDVLKHITNQERAAWNAKSDFSGSYNDLTNKPTIPVVDVTKSYVDTELAKKADKTGIHTHTNKNALDTITSAKISSWDSKSTFDGDYRSLLNKPFIPTLLSQLTNDAGYLTTMPAHNHDILYYRKSEVDQKIADAVTGGTIDLSGYLTKDEASSVYATASSLDRKVDKVQGKGLSENDYTTIEKNKLAALNNYTHPATHPASIIDQDEENRFVTDAEKNSWNAKSNFSGNYSDLTGKPDLTSLHSHTNRTVLNEITSAKVSEWNSKSDFSGNYNDLSNKPSIPTKVSQLSNDSGYLTSIPDHDHNTLYYQKSEIYSKPEVDQKISDAVTEGAVDLSGYLTKEEAGSTYSTKEFEHSHKNKTILDSVTSAKVSEWDSKSTFSGSYTDLTNKPVIPTVDVTKSYVDAELSKKANTEDMHTHSNKSTIDSITAAKISEWNNKSEFSGSYTDLYDKPTIPTVDVTKSYVDTELAKKADKLSMHEHQNKSVLDGITLDNITEWNNKSEFSGDYYDLTSRPTIPYNLSDLSNDLGFVDSSHEHDARYYKKDEVDKKITDAVTGGTVDLSGYLTTTDAEETYAKIDSLNHKVDKITGKGLSTNDYTNEEKDKLSSLSNYTHPNTHEASMIVQTPFYRFTTDEEKLAWDLKSEFSGSYEDLSGKPDLSSLHSHSNYSVLSTINASKISSWDNKSDFSGSYTDLTDKPVIPTIDVTKSYVDTELAKKADVTDLHSHSNIEGLSKISNEKISYWDNKSDFSGSYTDLTNKPVIPTVDVTKSYVDAELDKKADVTDLHSHANIEELSKISNEKISYWDNKSDFNGNYEHLTNKPVIPIKTSELVNDSEFITADHYHDDRYYDKLTVDQKIADASTGGTVDLSGYLTKEEAESEYATIEIADGKVDKIAGKGLSTNDYSNAEKEKLSNLFNYEHPENHDASMIIQNQSYRFVTDLEKMIWNEKSDFSGNYSDLENIPEIPTALSQLRNDTGFVTSGHDHNILYYQKSEVDEKIEEAAMNVDLTDYVTKNEANLSYASKLSEHGHSNIGSLNEINAEKILSWDNKSDFSGSYTDLTDKPVIPTIDVTKEYVDAGLGTKVDKVDGKGLSANDYTTSEKNKLAGLSNYSHPDTHSATMIEETEDRKFVTDDEKLNWDNKYTRAEVDLKINEITSGLDWKQAVDTFDSIETTYPDPEDGWTVNVNDTDITYRYTGSSWIAISANAIPIATSGVDGKMSKDDKAKLDGIEAGANNYSHPGTHEASIITQSSSYRFVTDAEKNTWNEKSNFSGNYNDLTNKPIIPTVDVTKAYVDTGLSGKVDKANGKDLSTNDYTNAEKDKLNSINISDKVVLSNGDKNFIIGIDNDGALTTEETSENPTVIIGCNPVVTNTLDGSVIKFWKGTQAQYDAISEKDSATFYIVVG